MGVLIWHKSVNVQKEGGPCLLLTAIQWLWYMPCLLWDRAINKFLDLIHCQANLNNELEYFASSKFECVYKICISRAKIRSGVPASRILFVREDVEKCHGQWSKLSPPPPLAWKKHPILGCHAALLHYASNENLPPTAWKLWTFPPHCQKFIWIPPPTGSGWTFSEPTPPVTIGKFIQIIISPLHCFEEKIWRYRQPLLHFITENVYIYI